MHNEIEIYYTITGDFGWAMMDPEKGLKKKILQYEFPHEMPGNLVEYCEIVFKCMNVKDTDDVAPFMLGCRSMSIGDIVSINGRAFLCYRTGWKEGTIKPSVGRFYRWEPVGLPHSLCGMVHDLDGACPQLLMDPETLSSKRD